MADWAFFGIMVHSTIIPLKISINVITEIFWQHNDNISFLLFKFRENLHKDIISAADSNKYLLICQNY